ncbi:MAG: DNA primase [Candidatus Nanopelagicales bacterium]
MAGRIHDEDVAAVRERSRIDDVVRDYLTLKPAGGGSLKGICPFHDEKTPSFHVTPSKGLWFCFGCNEGGDTVNFIQRVDHLTFSEAIEKLAGKLGMSLRYVATAGNSKPVGNRTRLVEANKLAEQFYQAQLATPAAEIGRNFLQSRGFDKAAAEQFGVGYAPDEWGALTEHLRKKGFTVEELKTAGLAIDGQRGVYDRFRGRLIWPIKDSSGDTIGFGARKLKDSDDGPKYLNTPETPLYKKSQVLYGIDLARKEIARRRQAVIVEGYTDVMAAHLSGVATAVATCGTAFGEDHVRILRRLLMDQEELRGEVIFTFDGDAAGQKAALKAFELDSQITSQTFVAIEPTGLDPCDLRLQHGPEAVRELVARRVPLFEFAIKSSINQYPITTPEGRVAATRAIAPMIAGIKDPALRPEYLRLAAGWIGVEPAALKDAMGKKGKPTATESLPSIDLLDPVVRVEREALKIALQHPDLLPEWFAAIEESSFSIKPHQAAFLAISQVSSVSATDFVSTLLDTTSDPEAVNLIRALLVEPIQSSEDQLERYGKAVYARVMELDATRQIADLKRILQRLNPVDEQAEYDKLFAELVALEQHRRTLREQAMGI